MVFPRFGGVVLLDSVPPNLRGGWRGTTGYPPEFGRKVLDLVEAGRPIAEVAQALGISDQSIYAWRRQDPGQGPVGTTQLVAVMGRPGRFPNAGAFKAFTGLTPRAVRETGQTDRKHQPMTKAGPRALRSQLVQSADTARKLDPQLAEVYHAQMTQRGATHRKALCVWGPGWPSGPG
jgi:transposase